MKALKMNTSQTQQESSDVARDGDNKTVDTKTRQRGVSKFIVSGQWEIDSPFNLSFKVLLSRCSVPRASVSVEGDKRVKKALDDMYNRFWFHSNYGHSKVISFKMGDVFLQAVLKAAKMPPGPSLSSADQEPGDAFDICLTVEVDQNLQPVMKIETSDECPEAMKRVVTEGTAKFDMDRMWNPMMDAVRYVISHAFSPSK